MTRLSMLRKQIAKLGLQRMQAYRKADYSMASRITEQIKILSKEEFELLQRRKK